MPGVFTVSLDLELYWGVRDSRSFEDYGANLRGERDAIRGILDLFQAHDIHATWATLGFLFFKDIAQLRQQLPGVLPDYQNQQLSSYRYIDERRWGDDDLYHFAPDAIEQILRCPGQEVGTHTFSHYYCLEEGQTIESFRADLRAAVEVAKGVGIPTTSLNGSFPYPVSGRLRAAWEASIGAPGACCRRCRLRQAIAGHWRPWACPRVRRFRRC